MKIQPGHEYWLCWRLCPFYVLWIKLKKNEEHTLNEASSPVHHYRLCIYEERVTRDSATSLIHTSWLSSAPCKVVLRPQSLLPISFRESIIILWWFLYYLWKSSWGKYMRGFTSHNVPSKLLQMFTADFSVLSQIPALRAVTCDPSSLHLHEAWSSLMSRAIHFQPLICVLQPETQKAFSSHKPTLPRRRYTSITILAYPWGSYPSALMVCTNIPLSHIECLECVPSTLFSLLLHQHPYSILISLI